MGELKPCPFCGGKAKMVRQRKNGRTREIVNAFVLCKSCGARSKNVNSLHAAERNLERYAAKAWNARWERTCHMVGEWKSISQTQEARTETCSECGCEFGVSKRDSSPFDIERTVELPNFCPDCGCRVNGAKVVGE